MRKGGEVTFAQVCCCVQRLNVWGDLYLDMADITPCTCSSAVAECLVVWWQIHNSLSVILAPSPTPRVAVYKAAAESCNLVAFCRADSVAVYANGPFRAPDMTIAPSKISLIS